MSNLPKMLSKREIELEELEEAKYVQSLRDKNQKLQERCDRYKKALTEISNHYLTDESYEGDADYREIAIDALAAIGGDDD